MDSRDCVVFSIAVLFGVNAHDQWVPGSQGINEIAFDCAIIFLRRSSITYPPGQRGQWQSLKLDLCIDKLYITAAILVFHAMNSGNGFRKFEGPINQTWQGQHSHDV